MALEDEWENRDKPEEINADNVPETSTAASSEPLAWMNDTVQWGVRAEPGKHGLTMRDLNIGSYGEVPESSSRT